MLVETCKRDERVLTCSTIPTSLSQSLYPDLAMALQGYRRCYAQMRSCAFSGLYDPRQDSQWAP